MKTLLKLGFTFLTLFCLNIYGQTFEQIKGKELYLRQTVNSNRKIYVSIDGKVAYYIHDDSRLFPVRKEELVKIKEINNKKEYVEISFESKNLGKGRVRIYDADSAELIQVSIKSIFSETAGNLPKYILNKSSNVVHFAGANHLPAAAEQSEIPESEIENGHKKCSICFIKIAKVSSYDLESRLGSFTASQVQMQSPLVVDDDVQKRVRAAGERVLKKWIMPLKGYNYRFYAIDDEITNAFAAPAGRIFITTALLNSLESDEELEAVLAHEIAHVELRHGYRQFRSFQKAAFWGGLLAVAAGAYNQQLFELTNVLTQIASSIVLSGHSRRYESEADAMAYLYFESNKLGSGKVSFRNVLRKLQYHQDYYQPDKTTSSLLATHPQIDERIDAIEKSTMSVFDEDDIFYGYNSQGDLVATLSFQVQRSYTGTLNQDDSGLQVIALVETTSALGDKDKIKEISINSDNGTLLFDNKEDTEVLPNDSVGASFVIKTQRDLLKNIKGINLKLRNVTKWEKGSLNIRADLKTPPSF